MVRSLRLRRPARRGVIADDLTGATDVAAAFADRGFDSLVVVNARARLPAQAEIILLTTNSRHDSPPIARRKVLLACRWLRDRRVRIIYKKIDSTVKGNVVAEAETLRDAAGFACAVVCPANPVQGRVVRRGVLRVRGTSAGRLEKIFAAQGLRVSLQVHTPVSARKVAAAIRSGARFVIADATSQQDLNILVRAGLDLRVPVLLAGSAGMAASLAATLAARGAIRHGPRTAAAKGGSRRAHVVPPPNQGRLVLVVAGSRNPVTRRQLLALERLKSPLVLNLDDLALTAIESESLREVGCVVVRAPVHDRSDEAIVRNLQRLVPLFRRRQIAAMFLTGGDTALLVCRWLRVAGIAMQGEIVPGLAWGRVVGGAADGLPICTKPGGFGDERSILAALEFLSAL